MRPSHRLHGLILDRNAGAAMTSDTQAIVKAIQDNFHQIMAANPQEKRRLIDQIFDYETVQQSVAEAMAEPEFV